MPGTRTSCARPSTAPWANDRSGNSLCNAGRTVAPSATVDVTPLATPFDLPFVHFMVERVDNGVDQRTPLHGEHKGA